jgi:energy-coupling factor transport system permease protein
MSDIAGITLMLGFCIFISAGNGMKWAIKMFLVYIAVSYLNALMKYVSIPGLSVIMSVFGVTVLKMIPIVMMGYWILTTTHMDDLMVSLQRMRIPQSVTIPLVVMFRYIPTLRIEYRMIRNTMSIRGICDTWGKKILHPLSTVEYILIPLLMRCLKVTDELAASGTTRGLERDEKRYSLNRIRFSIKEYAVVIGGVIFLGGLFIMDHTSLGELILWRV